jgi:hypothetical protein
MYPELRPKILHEKFVKKAICFVVSNPLIEKFDLSI